MNINYKVLFARLAINLIASIPEIVLTIGFIWYTNAYFVSFTILYVAILVLLLQFVHESEDLLIWKPFPISLWCYILTLVALGMILFYLPARLYEISQEDLKK